MTKISDILKSGSDIERILGRLRNRMARPRELGGLRSMLRGLPAIREALLNAGKDAKAISLLAEGVISFDSLRELLENALEEELPADIKVDVKGQGGAVIRKGYDKNLIACEKWQLEKSAGLRNLRSVSVKAPVFLT